MAKSSQPFGPMGNARPNLERTIAMDSSCVFRFPFADEAADEEERRGGMAFFGVLHIWRGQLEKIKELNQALRRAVEGWDAFGPEVPKAHSEVKIPVTRPKTQAVKRSCFK